MLIGWIYRSWILLDLQELDSIGSPGVGLYWISRSWILLDLQELDSIGHTGVGDINRGIDRLIITELSVGTTRYRRHLKYVE